MTRQPNRKHTDLLWRCLVSTLSKIRYWWRSWRHHDLEVVRTGCIPICKDEKVEFWIKLVETNKGTLRTIVVATGCHPIAETIAENRLQDEMPAEVKSFFANKKLQKAGDFYKGFREC